MELTSLKLLLDESVLLLASPTAQRSGLSSRASGMLESSFKPLFMLTICHAASFRRQQLRKLAFL